MIPKEGLKIIIALILVFSLAFFPLHIARAVSGWLIVLKEYVLDLIARIITRILLSVVSNGITRTILTSGRDCIPGQLCPAFVRDWGDFLRTAQYRGEDILRATVANVTQGASATACPYLRDRLAVSFGAQNRLIPGFNPNNYRLESLEPFKLLTQCTLSPGLNVGAFQNSFSQGGWAAWNQLIQPQNNFFGTYTLGLDELAKQRQFQEYTDLGEAGAGSGYTSKRTGCTGMGANQQCTIYGKIITPGDLFGKSGAATIDRELDWLVSADELEEALVNLAGVVINKLTNFVVNAVLSQTQGALGPGTGEAPPPNIGGAQQDCVNACIQTNCPAALPACTYTTDPLTGAQTVTNAPCTPNDIDPRNACVANCQARGCN